MTPLPPDILEKIKAAARKWFIRHHSGDMYPRDLDAFIAGFTLSQERIATASEINRNVANRNHQLNERLTIAVGALEYYAEGSLGGDLEVRPDKKELWSIPEKWSQRSMSDHWSGKRARETLSKLRTDENEGGERK